jgi:hypothetical protein
MRKPISAKQIITEYEQDTEGSHWEWARCPYCQVIVSAPYQGNVLAYWEPSGACAHFEDFVSAGGTAVAAQFRGIAS